MRAAGALLKAGRGDLDQLLAGCVFAFFGILGICFVAAAESTDREGRVAVGVIATIFSVVGVAATCEAVSETCKRILAAVRYRHLVGEWPAKSQEEFEEQKRDFVLPLLGREALQVKEHPGARHTFYETLDAVTNSALPYHFELAGQYDRSFKSYLKFAPPRPSD